MNRSGSSASLAAVYQEALLAHYRKPHNRRELPGHTNSATYRNPVCGDEISVFVKLNEGLIEDISFQGRGCSVATASASMMTGVVKGCSINQARAIWELLEKALADPSASVSLPSELAPLQSVVSFPGRHGCVRMAWQALRMALRQSPD